MAEETVVADLKEFAKETEIGLGWRSAVQRKSRFLRSTRQDAEDKRLGG
jgi:hypothetical protein